MAPARFCFDVGSPYAWLAAERLESVLAAVPVRWQPVLLGGLFRSTGRSSWAGGEPAERRAGMAEVERRAARYGLPPVRWPEGWPGDYLFAMRAVTHAFSAGAGDGQVLARAAMRAAFTAGVDLSPPSAILQVADEVGLDPAAVQAGAADPAVKQALRTTTDDAHAAGVFGVPSLIVGERVFWGDDELEAAAAALA